uniref:Rhomboid-like protein n=1 Tax=Rhizophora mucronata TaxID=61149 RepID=A0A2P2P499_RHIMU
MQRLCSGKLIKKLSNNSNSDSSILSHTHRTFTSLAAKQVSQFKIPIQHSHLCQPHPTTLIPGRNIQGSSLFPFLYRQFSSILTKPHFRASTKSLPDCKGCFFRSPLGSGRAYSVFGPGSSYYGRGWRSWINRLTPNDTVLGLIIANVAVFLLWRIADRSFMMKNFMISLDNVKSGHIHTLLTSAFSHIDAEHIISNMIGLYFFGTNIARNFGPEYLLKLYLAGAIGGSVLYLVHHALLALWSEKQGTWAREPSRTPGLGASGAVNAILLLDIFLNPRATLYFDFIIPIPAILLGIFLIGRDLLRMIEGDANISGSAHLGGAAVAAMAWARIRKGRF